MAQIERSDSRRIRLAKLYEPEIVTAQAGYKVKRQKINSHLLRFGPAFHDFDTNFACC